MGVCGSSIQDLPNPDRIDLSHFQEYKVIGRGGFGTVHAVVKRDPTTGKDIKDTIYAMKRLSKEKIVTHQVNLDMLWLERDILIAASEKLKSNFLCQLYWAFQNEVEVFLVMEFLQGGDLRFQMRTKENLNKQRPLAENVARFYAAEILLALNDLHNVRIVYRDLKPENALLDNQGHLRLVDFGIAYKLSSREDYKTTGRSGTLGYMSPEMLMKQPYGTEVDVWAYGVTLYELLHADLPWEPYQGAHNPAAVMEHFSHPLYLSSHISTEARDLLSKLLQPDINKRLVSWPKIKAHPFFASIDWTAVANLKVAPPIVPEQGVANCTSVAQLEVIFMDEKPKPIPAELQEVFADFEYTRSELREHSSTATVDPPPETGAEYVVSLTTIDSTSLETGTSAPNMSDDAGRGISLHVSSAHSDGANDVSARDKDRLCFNPVVDVQEISVAPEMMGFSHVPRISQARMSVNARKVKTSASRNNSISSLGEETDEYLRQQGLLMDPSDEGSPEPSQEDVYDTVMRMMGSGDSKETANGRGSKSVPRVDPTPRNSSSNFVLQQHQGSTARPSAIGAAISIPAVTVADNKTEDINTPAPASVKVVEPVPAITSKETDAKSLTLVVARVPAEAVSLPDSPHANTTNDVQVLPKLPNTDSYDDTSLSTSPSHAHTDTHLYISPSNAVNTNIIPETFSDGGKGKGVYDTSVLAGGILSPAMMAGLGLYGNTSNALVSSADKVAMALMSSAYDNNPGNIDAPVANPVFENYYVAAPKPSAFRHSDNDSAVLHNMRHRDDAHSHDAASDGTLHNSITFSAQTFAPITGSDMGYTHNLLQETMLSHIGTPDSKLTQRSDDIPEKDASIHTNPSVNGQPIVATISPDMPSPVSPGAPRDIAQLVADERTFGLAPHSVDSDDSSLDEDGRRNLLSFLPNRNRATSAANLAAKSGDSHHLSTVMEVNDARPETETMTVSAKPHIVSTSSGEQTIANESIVLPVTPPS